MFQGLKIAVQKQKKLLFLFLITIFLPSLALSIFGIKALKNEKYRLSQIIENEQYKTSTDVIEKVGKELSSLEEELLYATGQLSQDNPDNNNMVETIEEYFIKEPLAEHILVLYENKEPVFPLFYYDFNHKPASPTINQNDIIVEQIKSAEEAEFLERNFSKAAIIYNRVYEQLENSSNKAQILSRIARNLYKNGNFREASEVYSRVISDYQGTESSSGIPLDLLAGLQLIECNIKLLDSTNAIETGVHLIEKIIDNKWNLSETRFNTYSDILIENLTEIKSGYSYRIDSLKKQLDQKRDEWAVINNMKSLIVPELRVYLQSGFPQSSIFKFSKIIADEIFLIMAVIIPGQADEGNRGILAVKLNNSYLQDSVLIPEINELPGLKNTSLYVRSINGESIWGSESQVREVIKTTAMFEANFPPWQLELTYEGVKGSGRISLVKSFYFWTIITLIVILVFGTVLVGRTIVREMELLKIKSDFVSSVSHEFKTPLTSMKVLTERLQEGKVSQENKLKQYLSFISHDIDRLIRLVSNILNFSRIEEGKKIYTLEETALSTWILNKVDEHKKENKDKEYEISMYIQTDLPSIKINRESIGQALFNLLDNALKFSLPPIEIGVDAFLGEKGVIIKIKDKGIGIKPDEKVKIFEKFYRGSNAIKYSVEGTGLGLAFVKYTIEAHGGTIRVIEEPGWKTVFSIWLPVN